MKLRLLSLLTLLLVSTVSAQNNQGGTLVTAPIRPFAVQDTFPTAIANEIKGGPFTAADLTGLASIPPSRLEIGSLGYARDTGLFYRLTSLSPVTWSPLDGSNFINLPTSSTNVSGTLSISSGGTGATNVSGAKVNLGLSSSDNVNFNTLLVSSGSSSANAIQLGTNDVGLYRATSTDILYINNKGNTLAIGTNGPITATEFSATTLNIGVGGSITFNDAGPTRTNLGLGVTNSMTFLSVTASNSNTANKSTLDETGISGWNKGVSLEQGGLLDGGSLALSWSTNQITAFAPINFFTPEIAESTRVNLGFNSATSVSFSNLTVTGGRLTNLGISIGAATRGFFSISDPERLTAVSGGIAVMSMFPTSIELGSNIPLQFSGTGAAITRTNLGLGAAWLTNNNVTNFRSDIGLGTSSSVTFGSIFFTNAIQGDAYAMGTTTLAIRGGTNNRIQFTLLGNQVISEMDGTGKFYSPGIEMIGSNGAISFASTNSTGAGITRTNLGLGNSSDVTFSKMHLGFAQQFGSTTYTLTLGQTNSGFIKDSAAGTGTGTDEWSFHSSGSRVWGARWRYIGNTTNTERYFEAPNSVLQKIEARDINLNITYDSPGGTEPFINFNTGQFAETNKTISFKGTSYFNGSISGQPIYTPRILLQNGNLNIASISRDEFKFGVPISFETTNNAAATRTNLGLGASWLTNTTREAFQNDMFTTNKYIVTGGPSIYSIVASWSSGTWDFRMPLNVTDPVGPDMPSYKAMTRTNLGLGGTDNVTFNGLRLGEYGRLSFISAAGSDIAEISVLTNPSTRMRFGIGVLGFPVAITATGLEIGTTLAGQGAISFSQNNTNGAATTRTNLGLGATWLTNTNAINISMGRTTTNTNTGEVLTGGTNGSLFMKGGDAVAYSSAIEPGGNAGYINLNGAPGGDGDGGDGGYINLSAGPDDGHGGSIDLRGDQYSKGGSIISTGSDYSGRNGGTLNMSAGSVPGGGNRSGGSITTMSGGGSIDTTGTGMIELGISNTRTTFVGSATTNRSISLPDASGTIALTNTLGSWAITTNASTALTNLGLGATWLTNSTAPLFWTSVPSTPTNSGTAGQIAYTNNFLYICISNNTWRRVQLGTW